MCVGSLDHVDNCKSFGIFNIFLTYQDNTTIFKHAFKYIKDSKRFTIVYMI
jgi:sRNA-binding regulator protein Hfq